jgi:DNA invertase Pin-like site-specific DNA recombinase
MIHGYARISTDGQSVSAQVAALRKHRAGKVFREVESGAKTDRAQLRRVLAELGPGDVLMVTRLDRLARIHPRPVEHARGDHREKGRLPITRRRMGRYHDGAWLLDVDRLKAGWRSSRGI